MNFLISSIQWNGNREVGIRNIGKKVYKTILPPTFFGKPTTCNLRRSLLYAYTEPHMPKKDIKYYQMQQFAMKMNKICHKR